MSSQLLCKRVTDIIVVGRLNHIRQWEELGSNCPDVEVAVVLQLQSLLTEYVSNPLSSVQQLLQTILGLSRKLGEARFSESLIDTIWLLDQDLSGDPDEVDDA